MKNKVLVFSIALNGYQWLYKDCIASHKRYAEINGYTYQVVTRPYATSIGVECCWLKLTLMIEALYSGYDAVMFVDADAYIQTHTPKLSSVLLSNKYVYLAKSYTGRYNSGVILIKNHSKVRSWLNTIITARHHPVLAENDVGWGENGHIIEHTKHCQFVSTLNRSWNNTYDPELNDYIRHFSFGPLRTSLWLNLSHKVLARLTKLFSRCQALTETKSQSYPPQDKLTKLTALVLQRYSEFGPI
ncbi:MAG: hypothetical protein ACI936_000656 [Paraglaciecola sp.]|jgi:hypothetical protein